MPAHRSSLADKAAANRAGTQPNLPARFTLAYERDLKAVRKQSDPTLLLALKHHAHQREQSPRTLAALTGISKQRIAALMNSVGQEEPWFDEAVTLARCLNTGGILPLITLSGTLDTIPKSFSTTADVDAYRAGLRLPLSLACRLALKFGLRDPIELVVSDLTTQIWDVLSTLERVTHKGLPPGDLCCPWCGEHAGATGEGALAASVQDGKPVGMITHAPTCLPDNLWSVRTLPPGTDKSAIGYLPRPAGPAGSRRGFSKKAEGLRALRDARFKTQAQMADDVGINANYYAKIEQGNIPLTLAVAERMAATYKVSVESLYAPAPMGDAP